MRAMGIGEILRDPSAYFAYLPIWLSDAFPSFIRDMFRLALVLLFFAILAKAHLLIQKHKSKL